MKDSQVMSGLWRKGYINFGEIVDGPIRQFKFEQTLVMSETDDSEQHNPISFANIELRCEKTDSTVLSKEDCTEKEMSLTSCNINVFKPYTKGTRIINFFYIFFSCLLFFILFKKSKFRLSKYFG